MKNDKKTNERKSILIVFVVWCAVFITSATVGAVSEVNNSHANSCNVCGESCKLSHKTALTSYHGDDYYYYTYRCTECGNEFTHEYIKSS